MSKSNDLRKLQLTVLIKQECERLDYRMPNRGVTEKWTLGYTRYVYSCLKNLGTMESNSSLKCNWVEHSYK